MILCIVNCLVCLLGLVSFGWLVWLKQREHSSEGRSGRANAAETVYVAARRKADKESVENAQELLDLETTNAKKPDDPSKKK